MKPRFKIWYRIDVFHAAKHLASQLNKLGYEAVLTKEVNTSDNEYIYILYCACFLEQLPPVYIVYQTEVPGAVWWNDHYYSLLRGAIAIWDYSASNMPHYAAKVPVDMPVSCVTPGVWAGAVANKDIPILFYGRLNAHRHQFLNGITGNYKVMKVENVFGDEMAALLGRSNIVLNIHHYLQAPVESFRINEALSHGCHVISQPSADMGRYTDLVSFADTPEDFKSHIYNALSRPFNYNLEGLDNMGELKVALETLAVTIS